jgi:carbon monoxide dehydrogenase subunit G
MYDHVIWPLPFDPKTSAIYALNDIDVNAPPEVVWKLLVDAENWSRYFPAEDQVKILSSEPELALGTKYSRVTVGFPMHLIVTEFVPATDSLGRHSSTATKPVRVPITAESSLSRIRAVMCYPRRPSKVRSSSRS